MPTSRLKVFADNIKVVASLGLDRFAVVIPLGRRIDVMAGVLTNVKKSISAADAVHDSVRCG